MWSLGVSQTWVGVCLCWDISDHIGDAPREPGVQVTFVYPGTSLFTVAPSFSWFKSSCVPGLLYWVSGLAIMIGITTSQWCVMWALWSSWWSSLHNQSLPHLVPGLDSSSLLPRLIFCSSFGWKRCRIKNISSNIKISKYLSRQPPNIYVPGPGRSDCLTSRGSWSIQ